MTVLLSHTILSLDNWTTFASEYTSQVDSSEVSFRGDNNHFYVELITVINYSIVISLVVNILKTNIME